MDWPLSCGMTFDCQCSLQTCTVRSAPPWSLAGFTIAPEEIARFEANPESLKTYGGIKGVAVCLRVDPRKGIDGTPDDIALRTDAFGPNTYPVKKPKIFLVRFQSYFFNEILNSTKRVQYVGT